MGIFVYALVLILFLLFLLIFFVGKTKFSVTKKIVIITAVLILFVAGISYIFITGFERGSIPLPEQHETSPQKDTVANKEPDDLQDVAIIESNPKPYLSDFLEMDSVLINGYPVILSKDEFEKHYPHKDSTRTNLWECGSPFEWLDKDWMIKTYGKYNDGSFEHFDGKITTIYTNHAGFNINKHIVLFDMAFAKNNNFRIKSHHIVLDENTTITEFQKMFPNLKKENRENPNQVRFRVSIKKEHGDAFLFYFKNGKLEYFTLWWLLC